MQSVIQSINQSINHSFTLFSFLELQYFALNNQARVITMSKKTQLRLPTGILKKQRTLSLEVLKSLQVSIVEKRMFIRGSACPCFVNVSEFLPNWSFMLLI